MSKPTTEAKPTAKPELFKVTLAKDHTHAGTPLTAGAKIDVTAPEREFLKGAGVIKTDAADSAAQ